MTATTKQTPRPAINQADFRADAEVPSTFAGRPIWLRVCYELVEGRWEGFTSMRRREV